MNPEQDPEGRDAGREELGALGTDQNLHFLMLYSLGLKVLLKENREKARIQPM